MCKHILSMGFYKYAKRKGSLSNYTHLSHLYLLDHERFAISIPSGSLILFDDYRGSGSTLKEAARALRCGKAMKNEVIQFTLDLTVQMESPIQK